MKSSKSKMEALVRAQPIEHLIKMQVLLLVLTSFIVLWYQDHDAVGIYLYGGTIGVLNSVLQRWHLYTSAKFAKADPGKNLGRAYRCIAERWLLTILMFAIGYLVFVPDMMLIVGFIASQIAVLFGNYNRA